jgi:hypothetical protein
VVLLSCILNLVPYTARVGDRHIANDGLGILRSFTQPEGRFAELLGAAYDDETDEWVSPGPAEGGKRG